MELIDKEKVLKEVQKVYDEGYKFLPSDLVESVDEFKDELLRVIDTLETKKVEDAFIEKACEWMSSHLPMQYGRIIIYNGFGSFIKDFRKAMKKR